MARITIATAAWIVNLIVMFLGLLGGVPIDLFYGICFVYSLVIALAASIQLPPRRRKM